MKKSLLFLVCTALLAFAGCVQKRIVWSPDGSRAVVLGDDGLRLMDPDGHLSTMLLPNVVSAAWLPGSSALALGTFASVSSWKEIAPHLSDSETAEIQQAAKDFLNALRSGANPEETRNVLRKRYRLSDNQFAAVALHLRDTQPEALTALSDAARRLLAAADVELHRVIIADVRAESVAVRATLARSLRPAWEIRVGSSGTAVAWTWQPGGKEQRPSSLLIAPVDAAAPAQVVMDQVAGYFDWSADGRSLLFIRRIPGGGEDELGLGSVARRTVLSENGALSLDGKTEDLAGVLFDESSKVRALADGRIVFSSAEIHLPVSAPDMPTHPQLFALDPERQATVTRLTPRNIEANIPETVGFFEVSPDGKRIALASSKGAISVFSIAAGSLQEVQSEFEQGLRTVPSWRNSNELSFVALDKRTDGPHLDVALWNGAATRMLSRDWPKAAREGLLE